MLSLAMPTAALVFAAAAPTWDVVVYGSSPAGIAAASAAGQLGLKVAVYEPLGMIGGMGAAGFLALHDGGMTAITGLAYNFTLLNGEYYGKANTPVQQPESFVSNASFYRMLGDAGVTHIKLDCRATAATTAYDNAAQSSKIESMTTVCETDPVTATVFIDASYDGDLMVLAGDVPYTAGRESIAQYNESLAGARAPSWEGVSGPKNISALDANGEIIKYVQNISTLAAPGEADDALMAFQHRLCVAGKGNMVPWPKPEGYNPDDFAIMQRCVDENYGDVMTGMPPTAMHDGGASGKQKYCSCCGISVCASDQPHLNAGWANATWERRQEIIADHIYFEMGSYYYLANDPKVPAAVRERFSSYGLCADEFVEFGNIPPQLYVRISNRMVSDYVMTQNNMANPLNKDDSIAVSDWSLDEHMTGKYAVPSQSQADDGGSPSYVVMLEGNFWPSVSPAGNWYDFPYKTLVPKRGVGGNLLVAVAFSASAVAYSSTRIESFFMATGSACGVAAAQLVDGSAATVQDVNVTTVQTILVNRFGQQIHGPPDGPTPRPPTPPAPKYYNVTGAGSESWNGQYVLKGDYDSSPLYQSVAASDQQLYLEADKGAWRLAVMGKQVYYLGGSASDRLPPTTGWTVPPGGGGGEAPAPTLTAGPAR
jgi:hypothetical protein